MFHEPGRSSRVLMRRSKLAQNVPFILLLEIAKMPPRLGFHERDSPTLDCMRDQHSRCSASLVAEEAAQDREESRRVMTIRLADVPSERPPTLRQRFDIEDVIDPAVETVFVAVDNRHKVMKAVVGSGRCRLPDLSFVKLA